MTPSTHLLLDWIAQHNADIFNPGAQSSEDYTLSMAVVALEERARQDLGKDYRKLPWDAPPELVAILRQSLTEHPTPHVAFALVRYGCRQSETMAHLDPWDALPFRLHPDDPLPLMGEHFTLAIELFGKHAVVAGIRDIGFTPTHDELFASLCASIDLDVGPVTQTHAANLKVETVELSDGSHAPVHRDDGYFLIEYNNGSFRANCRGTWMDVDAVLQHFNGLGRPERAWRLADARGENGEWVAFVTAETIPDWIPLA